MKEDTTEEPQTNVYKCSFCEKDTPFNKLYVQRISGRRVYCPECADKLIQHELFPLPLSLLICPICGCHGEECTEVIEHHVSCGYCNASFVITEEEKRIPK